MTRCTRLIVTALTLAGAVPADGQSREEHAALLLEYSEASSILESYRGSVVTHLTGLGVVVDAELEAVLDRHFEVEALEELLWDRFLEQGDDAQFTAAAALVTDGAIGRIERAIEADPPAEDLEAYVQTLQANPPPDARIELVAEVAGAQAAGEFFVMLFESTREAAHTIAAALDPSARPFEPMGGQLQAAQAEQSFYGAVAAFLHRYQKISDDDLRQALEEWLDPAGSWFAVAYSAAVGQTAIAAGELAAAELR